MSCALNFIDRYTFCEKLEPTCHVLGCRSTCSRTRGGCRQVHVLQARLIGRRSHRRVCQLPCHAAALLLRLDRLGWCDLQAGVTHLRALPKVAAMTAAGEREETATAPSPTSRMTPVVLSSLAFGLRAFRRHGCGCEVNDTSRSLDDFSTGVESSL
jgi:hypothetical protein